MDFIDKSDNTLSLPYANRLRKINYYIDYRVIVKNSKIQFKQKYYKVDAEKLRNEGVGGPLPKTKYCEFIGITPNYIGPSNGRKVITKNLFLKYITENDHLVSSDIKNKVLDMVVNSRSVIGGGINTNFKLLKDYANIEMRHYDIIELEKICMPFIEKLRLPKITDLPTKEDIYTKVNFNKDSKPGLYTQLLVGDKRSETIPITTKVAMNLYDVIVERKTKCYGLYQILGREKEVKISEDGEVTTRVVMNGEEPHMLLQSLFSQPITKMLSSDKDNNIFIGKNLKYSTVSKIRELRSKFDIEMSADWNNFDTWIPDEFIRLGTSILMSCYLKEGDDENNKKVKRITYYIYKSIQEKNVVIPPGFVYKITKGIPSGHAFGTLIGSIVNILYWCVIMYRIYGDGYHEKFDLLVSGDDSKVFTNLDEKVFDIDKVIKDEGMLSDSVNETMMICSEYLNIFDTPDFLRRHTDGYKIVWNREGILRRLLFHTSNKASNYLYIIEQCRNYIESAIYDDDMNKLLKGYVIYLCKSNGVEYTTIIRDINNRINDTEKALGYKNTVNLIEIIHNTKLSIRHSVNYVTRRARLNKIKQKTIKGNKQYLLSLYINLVPEYKYEIEEVVDDINKALEIWRTRAP